MQKGYTRKKLGSYPSIGVIISITLALIVIGLFGVALIYSNQLEKLVRDNIRMEVYLNTNLTETQRTQIEKKLEALPYISKQTLGSALQFISKEDAAKKFIEETGEDFTKLLGENPLHDAYLISIDPAYHEAAAMQDIKKEIEAMSGVFQVVPKEGLIETVNKNITSITLILFGLAALLLITVVLLINNTIRLALFSQRFLIRSMQLVGAKRWFIQRPFIVRSLLYGLIAALFASACIAGLVNYAHGEIEDLVLLMNKDHVMLLAVALMALGMLVAATSTFFSIGRYLKMSLDELY
ncbi:MAG: permease-like cell division protein FtsX [Cyclobacteriaceae bacterium]|nr:permease-like cell division protein FtsX [Cyclobacteriaceae bacterium]